MSARAARYNENKLRYDLIPVEVLRVLAEVYTKGAEKYTIRDEEGNILQDGSDNWRKGMPWLDVYASHMRHMEAWRAKEDIDQDLGTPHLGNALWNIATLIVYDTTKKEFDNRI